MNNIFKPRNIFAWVWTPQGFRLFNFVPYADMFLYSDIGHSNLYITGYTVLQTPYCSRSGLTSYASYKVLNDFSLQLIKRPTLIGFDGILHFHTPFKFTGRDLTAFYTFEEVEDATGIKIPGYIRAETDFVEINNYKLFLYMRGYEAPYVYPKKLPTFQANLGVNIYNANSIIDTDDWDFDFGIDYMPKQIYSGITIGSHTIRQPVYLLYPPFESSDGGKFRDHEYIVIKPTTTALTLQHPEHETVEVKVNPRTDIVILTHFRFRGRE